MNSLTDILEAARKAGLGQRERHETAIRYRDAAQEYIRVTPNSDYHFNAMQEHATIKALAYIERHRK